MNIYEFISYKTYLKAWLKALPKKGHGESRRIAEALGISTTMISQVLNGEKNFNLELASDLCDYLGLNEKETDYFFLLVEFERAGTHRLKQKLKKKIERLKIQASVLKERLEKDKELTDHDKATFYSSWIYSGIRNLIATDTSLTIDSISQRLQIPRNQIQKILDFLLESGLCELKQNKYLVGAKRTHLGNDSPLVTKHHQNWRMQGFNKMIFAEDKNLFYTAPMSLSKEAAQKIRQELPAFIEKINKWVVDSDSEIVRCLNIDFFEY
ncbi:MAG: TIGR02147 family protein [Bdellovibrionota bacterium]